MLENLLAAHIMCILLLLPWPFVLTRNQRCIFLPTMWWSICYLELLLFDLVGIGLNLFVKEVVVVQSSLEPTRLIILLVV